MGSTTDERTQMTSYWKEHSGAKTLETMMLDSNAATLNELEAPEILDKIPCFKGKDVLELASGIGRYTVHFANEAKSVTAVEFMQEFHDANVKRHSDQKHMEFICQDVTTLERQNESYDMVFSNWLLMYLGDVEVKQLALNLLKWLRTDGTLFFRESCFKQSGNAQRTSNPTNYRHPAFYIDAFRSAVLKSDDMDENGQCTMSYFDLVSASSVSAYRKLKNNNGQVCFLWQKVTKKTSPHAVDSFQQFLDAQQYSLQSIKRYERIFGTGYVSTGGEQTTIDFVNMLQLNKGDRVLDVGCGVGGGAFYMAEKFDVSVVGIDLSTNMINVALERTMIKPKLDVEFEVCDATKKEYPDNTFDVIYSRDTLLHIEDKVSMFKKFFKWLKPGGKLLISDYCCGDQKHTPEFTAYVAQRGYFLLTPEQYGKQIESSGFDDVQVEDRTDAFIGILTREVASAQENQDSFIQETILEDYQVIVDGWTTKIQRCKAGDQKWGLFIASKPL